MTTEIQLYLILNTFPDFKIEVMESEHAEGYTNYEPVVWIESLFLKDLTDKEKELYKKDGIIAFLDRETVTYGNSIPEVIDYLYDLLDREHLLEDIK